MPVDDRSRATTIKIHHLLLIALQRENKDKIELYIPNLDAACKHIPRLDVPQQRRDGSAARQLLWTCCCCVRGNLFYYTNACNRRGECCFLSFFIFSIFLCDCGLGVHSVLTFIYSFICAIVKEVWLSLPYSPCGGPTHVSIRQRRSVAERKKTQWVQENGDRNC